MEYITNNGIRFTQKDNTFSIQSFISNINETTLICLTDDILLDFTNGCYCGVSDLPF